MWAALCVGALAFSWAAAPAWAAAPGNDTQAGATLIGALPFADTVDTSEATTDAQDAALNADCGAPVTNGSVWYSYTAPAGVDGIVVDVSASNFSAGALIAASDGSGGWYVVACGPGATGSYVYEGGEYAILAFSDTPGVTGGTLQLTVEQASVPTVDLTVNPRGKVDRYGNAVLSGTVRCSGGDFLEIGTSLKQPVGRFAVQGDGWVSGPACDGALHSWSAVVVPYNGKFAGGKAASFTWAFSCGEVFCGDSYVEQTVRLSK
jgi:hypothetical protein